MNKPFGSQGNDIIETLTQAGHPQPTVVATAIGPEFAARIAELCNRALAVTLSQQRELLIAKDAERDRAILNLAASFIAQSQAHDVQAAAKEIAAKKKRAPGPHNPPKPRGKESG